MHSLKYYAHMYGNQILLTFCGAATCYEMIMIVRKEFEKYFICELVCFHYVCLSTVSNLWLIFAPLLMGDTYST